MPAKKQTHGGKIMVVQHNLTAMNSNRMLGITQGSQAKSTEKLSSGYKINRAADDAAGLSISEKMRKQIRGLTQASLNAEDGISAVQTAEGALNEVQDMLQRMNELAVKAANGTMSENDRNYIQDEISQLETEIDRVAETTKFNETYLLKGDKTVEKEFTFKYNETTPYTFEAKDAPAAVRVKSGVQVYNAAGAEVKSADVSSNDELSDLTPGNYFTAIQGKASAKLTGAVSTGTNATTGLSGIVKVDGTSGTLTYESGKTLYKADGSAMSESEMQAALTAKQSSTTYDQIWVNAGVDVYTDIEGTTAVTSGTLGNYFEVAEGPYTFRDATSDQGTTDIASYVTVENGTLKYADANKKLELTDGTAIDEANLGTYIAFEAGETTTVSFYDADGNKIAANALDNYIEAEAGEDAATYSLKDGVELYKENGTAYTAEELDSSDEIAEMVTGTQDLVGALTLKLHVGADATANNQISIDMSAMSAKGLGVKGILVSGKDDTNARAAIDTIKEAIQKVSTQRSALGAVQNRLEHTINNLDNVVENTTAAESQIRDTDMATEMVKYSNNNILAQAGQSMLAQANQSNQGVLSLLG